MWDQPGGFPSGSSQVETLELSYFLVGRTLWGAPSPFCPRGTLTGGGSLFLSQWFLMAHEDMVGRWGRVRSGLRVPCIVGGEPPGHCLPAPGSWHTGLFLTGWEGLEPG